MDIKSDFKSNKINVNKVGIGTQNPETVLTLGNNSENQTGERDLLRFSSKKHSEAFTIRNNDTSTKGKLEFYWGNLTNNNGTHNETTSVANILTLQDDGNIGIGTVPTDDKLVVDGNINIKNGNLKIDGSDLFLNVDATNVLSTLNTSQFEITNSKIEIKSSLLNSVDATNVLSTLNTTQFEITDNKIEIKESLLNNAGSGSGSGSGSEILDNLIYTIIPAIDVDISTLPQVTPNIINDTHNYLMFTYTSDSSGLTGQTQYDITFNNDTICDILIVGGGGGGSRWQSAGGGGDVLYFENVSLNGNYIIKVGNGGSVPRDLSHVHKWGGYNGEVSSITGGNNDNILNIFAGGGAGAGGWSLEPLNPNTYSYTNPKNGNIEISSGGGAGTPNASFPPSTGNNVSGNGSQGDYDGNADSSDDGGGGGGGGGGTNGHGGTPSQENGGLGGDGEIINITGNNIMYGKGGNGWGESDPIPTNVTEHIGHGGNGASQPSGIHIAGGSGVVIIRYKKYVQDEIKILKDNVNGYLQFNGTEWVVDPDSANTTGGVYIPSILKTVFDKNKTSSININLNLDQNNKYILTGIDSLSNQFTNALSVGPTNFKTIKIFKGTQLILNVNTTESHPFLIVKSNTNPSRIQNDTNKYPGIIYPPQNYLTDKGLIIGSIIWDTTNSDLGKYYGICINHENMYFIIELIIETTNLIQEPDIINNLIAHYKFDGDLTNSVVGSSIGTLTTTNIPATFINTVGNFKFGQSALINNTTLTIPNFHFSNLLAGSTKSFTVSFWFKANSITGTWNILFDASRYATSSDRAGIRIYINIKSTTNELLIIGYNGSGSSSYYVSSLDGGFIDNTWRLYTFTFTYNSHSTDIYSYDVRFYENNILNNGVNIFSIKNLNTEGFHIGDGNPDQVYPNEGYYDDFRIYDKALSGTEVANLYNHYSLVIPYSLYTDDSHYISTLTGMDGWTKIKHSPVNVGKISGNTLSGSTITGSFTIGDSNDDTAEWAIPFDAPNVKYFCFHSKDSDINNNFKDRWVVIERSEMIRTSQLAGTYDYHSSYPHYYKTTYKPNGFVAKNSTYYTGGRRDQIIYNRSGSSYPDPTIATYYVKKDGSVIDPHTNPGDIATLFSPVGHYLMYRENGTDQLLGIEQAVYVKYTDDINPSIPEITHKTLTFTHDGSTDDQTDYTINFHEDTTCDILIVGGGGGGGEIGGGGGGGGVIYAIEKLISKGIYEIKVGKGGLGGIGSNTGDGAGEKGKNTIAFGATADGGGGGAGWAGRGAGDLNTSGGSGGGGSYTSGQGKLSVFTDNSQSIIYSNNNKYLEYGSQGRQGQGTSSRGGGGGGASGINASTSGVNGVDGIQINIDGNNYYWAGGGGGYSADTSSSSDEQHRGDGGKGGGGGGGGTGGDTTDGKGGIGGITLGGNSSDSEYSVGGEGGQHTGGGGGGGGGQIKNIQGASGGSGIVIIKYSMKNNITNTITTTTINNINNIVKGSVFYDGNRWELLPTTSTGIYTWDQLNIKPFKTLNTEHFEINNDGLLSFKSNSNLDGKMLSILTPNTLSLPITTENINRIDKNYVYYKFIHDQSTNDYTEYTLTFNENTICDILIVGGGGGGGTGSSSASAVAGAGGGAGGLIYKNNFEINSDIYTIKIGRGGNRSIISSTTGGENGKNTSIEKFDGTGIEGINNFIAIGGGGGGKRTDDESGKDGGSGGGALGSGTHGNELQSISLSGGFGNQGGTSTNSSPGGGGGAGSVGDNGSRDSSTIKGNGGNGKEYDITGINIYYAGGGGSGKGATTTNHKNDHGIGGLGGGGNGWDNITYITSDDLNGTPHYGGGGGGGSQNSDNINGGNGGSGVIIIRFQYKEFIEESIHLNPATNFTEIQKYNVLTQTLYMPLVTTSIDYNTINQDSIYYEFTHDQSTNDYTEYEIIFPENTTCDILIVGGGGGVPGDLGGGGGAGGLILLENKLLSQGTYQIKVGNGGKGGDVTSDSARENATNGYESIFDQYTAIGGGRGACTGKYSGGDGGSGGGGSTSTSYPGGNGTNGQGYGGGNGDNHSSGGGGGAGSIGSNGISGVNGGDGGIGINVSSIFGTLVGDDGWFAGGGGGGFNDDESKAGTGGKGGGGDGTGRTVRRGFNGDPHTGGGGGGNANYHLGGAYGGSGIVIIKISKQYKFIETEIKIPNISGIEKSIVTITNNTTGSDILNTLAYDITPAIEINIISTPTVLPNIVDNTYNYLMFTYQFSGNYTDYSLNISQKITCDILIIGGGGGGGARYGGGGGAGLLIYKTNQELEGIISIRIGKGGIGAQNGSGSKGSNGEDTIFTTSTETLTAIGGGGGGTENQNANSGGSGGGGSYVGSSGGSGSGNGITSFGNDGSNGSGANGGTRTNGGGGGAGGPGIGNTMVRPDGGKGKQIDITGELIYYAGGGGGANSDHDLNGQDATGQGGEDLGSGWGGQGGGGGGDGGESNPASAAQNGAPNSGGGGGGGVISTIGGSGGSGVVIIKYKKNSQDETKIPKTNLSGYLHFNGLEWVVDKTKDTGTDILNGLIFDITPEIQTNVTTTVISNNIDDTYYSLIFKYTSDSSGLIGQTQYDINFDKETTCDILIVGGGGGGGSDNSGGGGAGGLVFLENITLNSDVTIIVGGGGAGAASGQTNTGQLGKDSSIIFSETYIAKGGGGGGTGQANATIHSGTNGGSGGGSAYEIYDGSPGTSIQNQYLLNNLRRGWGFAGGDGKNSTSQGAGGGGGGASEVGINGNSDGDKKGGRGGDGKYEVNSNEFKTFFGITDNTVGDHIDGKIYFAGGGGGGNDNSTNSINLSDGTGYNNRGGKGGGGDGGYNSNNLSNPGKTNTGGGGGGTTYFGSNYKGGDGGSGIVVIRYKKYIQREIKIPKNNVHGYLHYDGFDWTIDKTKNTGDTVLDELVFDYTQDTENKPTVTPNIDSIIIDPNLLTNDITIQQQYIKFIYDLDNDNGDGQTEYTINFPKKYICDILLVGGGGSGGSYGGGGGGGDVIYETEIELSGSYIIKVGKGGDSQTDNTSPYKNGNPGKNSIIYQVKDNTQIAFRGASGGGGGSGWGVISQIPTPLAINYAGKQYGSQGGGGGGINSTNGVISSFSGNGGDSSGNNNQSGGGGGGSKSNGLIGYYIDSTNYTGGNGGNGDLINITGIDEYYGGGGGGGGGGSGGNHGGFIGGFGGLGGGGNGQSRNEIDINKIENNIHGVDGKGGGGGGMTAVEIITSVSDNKPSGRGGSGIIIIKYKNPIVKTTKDNINGYLQFDGNDWKLANSINYGGVTTIDTYASILTHLVSEVNNLKTQLNLISTIPYVIHNQFLYFNTSIGITQEPTVFINNLIAQYKFDGDFTDSSGNGNDLITSSISTPTISDNGIIGNALRFQNNVNTNTITYGLRDGTCKIPSIDLVNKEFSISFWIKLLNNFDTEHSGIFMLGYNEGLQTDGYIKLSCAYYESKNMIDFYYKNDMSDEGGNASTDLSINIWYNITITITNSHLKVYTNNILTSTKSLFEGLPDIIYDTNYLGFYNDSTYTNTKDDFLIDSFSIYNKKLTITEISNLYNYHSFVIPYSLYTDTTYSLQSLAEFKTGVKGWRLVRFLPSTSTGWHPTNDDLKGANSQPHVYGTEYNYDNAWSVSFKDSGYDEFCFSTTNFEYWTYTTKVAVFGAGNAGASDVIKSSINSSPHQVKWYYTGEGTTGGSMNEPWVSLYDVNTAGTPIPAYPLYGENTYNGDYFNWQHIPDNGGACVFVRSSTDTETVNPTPEYKTLTFAYTPSELIFTFRQDESPYSWQEAYDEAIANGNRMPTKTELLDYLASQGNQPLYQEDAWCAVVAPEYSNGRDYIQIGNHQNHFVGKSNTENGGYPSWGDETNTYQFRRFYCEVIEKTQTSYTVNFTEETECDILIVGGGGGGGAGADSGVPGGGGGAGGLIFLKNQIVSTGIYTIKIGKGGNNAIDNSESGQNGYNSSFSYLQTDAIGGGGGGSRMGSANIAKGQDGGSGGGGSRGPTSESREGGSGTIGNIYLSDGTTIITSNYRQGYDGGYEITGSSSGDAPYAGGGGGAGGPGYNNDDGSQDGDGGIGKSGEGSNDFKTLFGLTDTNIGENHTDGKVYFAGGGACGHASNSNTGGLGGGGDGLSDESNRDGKQNTGGGGSGAKTRSSPYGNGGSGGSGIVIIRYKIKKIITNEFNNLFQNTDSVTLHSTNIVYNNNIITIPDHTLENEYFTKSLELIGNSKTIPVILKFIKPTFTTRKVPNLDNPSFNIYISSEIARIDLSTYYNATTYTILHHKFISENNINLNGSILTINDNYRGIYDILIKFDEILYVFRIYERVDQNSDYYLLN